MEEIDDDGAIAVSERTRREMYDRAERAYAEARVPVPADARRRMDEWRASTA